MGEGKQDYCIFSGGDGGRGGGEGRGQLDCYIFRDFMKPSLRLSFFCVLFVSKGNLLNFNFSMDLSY